jgi:hypothetical protein
MPNIIESLEKEGQMHFKATAAALSGNADKAQTMFSQSGAGAVFHQFNDSTKGKGTLQRNLDKAKRFIKYCSYETIDAAAELYDKLTSNKDRNKAKEEKATEVIGFFESVKDKLKNNVIVKTICSWIDKVKSYFMGNEKEGSKAAAQPKTPATKYNPQREKFQQTQKLAGEMSNKWGSNIKSQKNAIKNNPNQKGFN